MVANGQGKQLPVIVAPSGRDREAEQEFSRGFLGRFASIGIAQAVNASGSQQNPVKSRVAEGGSGIRALEGVEKRHSDTGYLRSATHMRIGGAGRGAQTSQRSGFNAAIGRESGTPEVPEAGLAESQLPIGFDALIAVTLDDFLPEFQRIFGFEEVRFLHDFREEVEVMNFSEHVLETFKIVAPTSIMIRKQAFDGIAKALQSNAQRVPGFWFFGAQGLGVKFSGLFEPFQRETFGSETANRNASVSLAQGAFQVLPRF